MTDATKTCVLPYLCPEHPKAQVKHLWDQTHYVLNGEAVGTGIKSNHRYECATCGRQLSEDQSK